MNRRAWVILLSLPMLLAAKPQPPREGLQPYLASVFPAGAQRGATTQAVISGQNMANVTGVDVSGDGVRGKIIKTATGETTIEIAVSSDAQPTERDLRLLSSGGLSNRVRLIVGQIPEVSEVEPNSTKKAAQSLAALPATVNGQLLEGDRDYFHFFARKGATIVAKVDSRILKPYIADAVPGWCDACLTMYDPAGRELSTGDDYKLRPDPVLIFKVPEDGRYILEIRDILFRGRGDFVYRLSVGELPFVTHIFPLGGQRGTSAQVSVFGVNFATTHLDLSLPADTAEETRPLWVESQRLRSNVVPFALSDLPEKVESEPNDSADRADEVATPIIINARIDKPGDVDHFTFAGKKGERMAMEVEARRYGSPMDAMLTLLSAEGKKLAENDDTPDPQLGMITHQSDARITFTIPKDGPYVLRVRDLQGKGGAEFGYRLRVSPLKPKFTLMVSPDTARAANGDNGAISVTAIRKDGFAAPIKISVDGLPKGYSATPATIGAGQMKTSFTVSVPSDAKPQAVELLVRGTARVDGKDVTVVASPTEEDMEAFGNKHLLPTAQLLLAVMQADDFLVSLDEPITEPIDLPIGREVRVGVNIKRPANIEAPPTTYSAETRPTSGPTPGGVSFKQASTLDGLLTRGTFVPGEKDHAEIILQASKKLAPGEYNVVFTGTMRTGRGILVRTLPAIPIRVTEAAKGRNGLARGERR